MLTFKYLCDDNEETNMAIDGSSISQVFSYSPGLQNYSEIFNVSFILQTNGEKVNLSNFGHSPALINGIKIDIISDETEYNIDIIKNNSDLISTFCHHNQLNGELNFLKGNIELPLPINLIDNDKIKVTITDNLSYLEFFKIKIGYLDG